MKIEYDPKRQPHPAGGTARGRDRNINLIYSGARYYDPMMGRFITADSIVSDIYDPQDLNRYAYCRNNPMKYVDPDGHAADTVWDLINIGMGIASFAYNVKTGNVSGAIVDALGIVGDSAAAVVPFLPGGVATGIKAYRAADTAADALKAARTGSAAVEQTAKAGSKAAVGGAETAAKNVQISKAKYGEAANHIADAQKAGHPDVLTISREGAPANRKASTGGMDRVPGKQLDEYPPAMFSEGGKGASVRAINPKDNMAAGACIGNACRGLPNGAKIEIKVTE